jgi:catechol 2,3-dioxygenase-like lactoylglutathione lyase family enzyme
MQIDHIALKLPSREAVDEASAYYQNAWSMTKTGVRDRRGLYTHDLTDGNVAFALTHFGDGSPVREAEVAGDQPSIFHIGCEVDDYEGACAEIAKRGYEVIGEPGQIPHKFIAPGGTVVEFAPVGYFTDRTKAEAKMPITHVALRLESREDAEAANEFYQTVCGFKEMGHRDRDERFTYDLSDGNISFALTVAGGTDPEALRADAACPPPSIHHIGFEVEDFEAYAEDAQKAGYELLCTFGDVPYKFIAPGGTIAEFVPKPYFTERI